MDGKAADDRDCSFTDGKVFIVEGKEERTDILGAGEVAVKPGVQGQKYYLPNIPICTKGQQNKSTDAMQYDLPGSAIATVNNFSITSPTT